MKIKIVPSDNRVGVEGVFKTVIMDFPDIHAVDFNGNEATIEHCEYGGEWKSQEVLSKDDFLARFGDILKSWEVAEEDFKAREPSQPAAFVEQVSIPENLVTRDEAQAMADQAAKAAVEEFAKTIAAATDGGGNANQ